MCIHSGLAATSGVRVFYDVITSDHPSLPNFNSANSILPVERQMFEPPIFLAMVYVCDHGNVRKFKGGHEYMSEYCVVFVTFSASLTTHALQLRFVYQLIHLHQTR